MPRVAILHFTASPHAGGIEGLIDRQADALSVLGRDVRLITGSGEGPGSVEVSTIPLLSPADPEIERGRQNLSSLPRPQHPLVTRLGDELQTALDGCDQCWVHNALTLHINPFLTTALLQVIPGNPHLRWMIWCHDFSPNHIDLRALRDVTYVTLSHTRRDEMARRHGIAVERVKVIPPALDLEWLSLTTCAAQLADSLDFNTAEPIVLVPGNLLPHKRPHLALEVTAALRDLVPRPLVLFAAGYSPHHPRCSAELRHTIEQALEELQLVQYVSLLSDPASRLDTGTLRDLIRLSDLVLLPSVDEGFGMPVWEAAALRTPVLCSDISAFREVAGDSATYFSLDADPASIARQALEISRTPQNQARRRALYSFESFQRQIEDLLKH